MDMELANIDWWAALAATSVGFLIGGCWYSPLLFGRFIPDLMAGTDSPGGESPVGASHYIAAVFTAAFVLLWLAASFLAGLLGPDASIREGVICGLALGLFLVFPAHSIAAMFGARPIQMVFINGTYFVVCLAAMGAILGAWH